MELLRKGLVLFTVLTLLVLCTSTLQAHPRVVLDEYFTNTNCGWCTYQHEPLQNYIANYTRAEAVLITYHVNWPGSGDPYYQHNTSENQTRWNYYGVSGVPDNYLDGTINILPNANNFTSTVDSRVGTDVPYLIEVVTEVSGSDVIAHVTLTVDGATTGDLRLHNVLCEELGDITPGSNGISDYGYSMLDMMPSGNGESISTTGAEVLTFDYTFSYTWEASVTNLSVVCFLQNHTSKEILQAGLGAIIADAPNLSLTSYTIEDADQAIPNNRPDPGETTDIIVTLNNTPEFLPTENLVGTLICDNDAVVIDDGAATWPNILAGTGATNSEDVFTISVPEGFEAQNVVYTISVSDDSGYETSFEFTQLTGLPDYLLVNDFGNGANRVEYWDAIFDSLDMVAESYESAFATTTDLGIYEYVIWATSNSSGDVISEDEETVIGTYLDNGGKVLLTGENVGEDMDESTWFMNYFAAEHHLNSAPSGETSFHVVGQAEGPLPEAEFWLMNGAGNNTNPSTVRSGDDGVVIYSYAGSPLNAAVGHMTDTYTAIYLGFNLEAISVDGTNDSQPAHEVLTELLSWLNSETSIDNPTDEMLPVNIKLSAYPNPFNAAVKLNFNLPETQNVKLTIFNTLGREVASLNNSRLEAGNHEISWDASHMSSGIYLVRLNTATENHMEKIMLIK